VFRLKNQQMLEKLFVGELCFFGFFRFLVEIFFCFLLPLGSSYFFAFLYTFASEFFCFLFYVLLIVE